MIKLRCGRTADDDRVSNIPTLRPGAAAPGRLKYVAGHWLSIVDVELPSIILVLLSELMATVKYGYYTRTPPNGRTSCLHVIHDLENEGQGHLKVTGRYYTQTIGDRTPNILQRVSDLQTQGQGHLKVKYRYYTQKLPNRRASCLRMLRHLENEPQGHLKVKYQYYTQKSPNRPPSSLRMVRDLENEVEGHLEVKIRFSLKHVLIVGGHHWAGGWANNDKYNSLHTACCHNHSPSLNCWPLIS